MDIGFARAARRVAEEGRSADFQRAAPVGRDAAVGDTFVGKVFEAGAEGGLPGEGHAESGIEAMAFDKKAVAVAVGIFVERGQPEGGACSERLIKIVGGTVLIPGAGRGGDFTEGPAIE